jgi:hypothetical protein
VRNGGQIPEASIHGIKIKQISRKTAVLTAVYQRAQNNTMEERLGKAEEDSL